MVADGSWHRHRWPRRRRPPDAHRLRVLDRCRPHLGAGGERILLARSRGAIMKPSVSLRQHYTAVMAAFARWPAISNVRIFGSVAEGDDRETSNLNLLVDAASGTSYFDLGAI